MINYRARKNEKKESGLDFNLTMIESFPEHLKENSRTQDKYFIDNTTVIVNQRGGIAFSDKNDDLISKIENKTGYKIKCQ